MTGQTLTPHITRVPCDPMEPAHPMEPPTEILQLKSRCTAKNRQGERCGKTAIPGGNVCRNHGGASPQVQRKAHERITEARDQALRQLQETLEVQGDIMDPKVLLDIVVRLTDKAELLEGRATARTESTTTVRTEEVRAEIQAKMDELAQRRSMRDRIIDQAAGEL